MRTALAAVLAIWAFLGCWFPAGGAAGTAGAADADAAIMQRLRAAVRESDPDWLVGKPGWMAHAHGMPDAHPCLWKDVKCDAQHRITRVGLISVDAPGPNANQSNPTGGPLLPELAQLGRLEKLILIRYAAPPWPSIPAEWLAPGAFPRLKLLSLAGRSLAAPLPDIRPGSLPSLEYLEFEFRELRTTLPPSWGASPAVLPGLLELSISAQIEGQLPAGWSAGFRQLEYLDLTNLPPGSNAVQGSKSPAYVPISDAIRAAAARGRGQRPGTAGRLPEEWAAGGFPHLHSLTVSNMDLEGPLPLLWQYGGFRSLSSMSVEFCGLTGTLAPQLLGPDTKLRWLWLAGNKFQGTLPAAWAAAAKEMRGIDLANNSFSGPIFQPAWLAPGAWPRLWRLDVSGNSQLMGSLPANLPWHELAYLRVSRTGVEGTVPAAWCQSPIASKLRELWIDGTAIKRVLPPCASKLPSQLTLMPDSAGMAGTSDRASSAAPGSLALSLLLASLALLMPACMAAGAVLLRRRRRLQRAEQTGQLLEVGRLLGEQWDGPESAGTGKVSPGLPISWASSMDSRQERVTRSLFAGAVGSAGSCCSVPLVRLPTAAQLAGVAGVAHHLGPGSQAPAHCFAAGPPPLETVPEMESLGICEGGRLGASWALPSDSLQVQADQLEFTASASGKPIVLGEGSQSIVFLAKLQHAYVAAKVVELLPGMDREKLWREAALLRRSAHKQIVPLLGVAISGNIVILAMQLMRGGSLQKALLKSSNRDRLQWEAGGRQVAMDVAEGLRFLHSVVGVQHNDLKPSNVLLTADLRACISDLGVAQVVGSKGHTMAGCSHSYAAPEQLMGQRCTPAADMFSFGVLLIELTTQTVSAKHRQWRLPRVPDECSPGVLALIEQCISTDPAHRPSAAEALQQLRADAVRIL